MAQFTSAEFQQLSSHLSKKNNMHLRKAHVRNKERTLKYVNIMCRASDVEVLGHVAGPAFDIEYAILNGTFRIIRSANTVEETLDVLEKESRLILKRILTDDGESHPVSYTPGQFYVKRSSKGGRVTPALEEAMSGKVFPTAFKKNVVGWGMIVIKGQKKKPKTK